MSANVLTANFVWIVQNQIDRKMNSAGTDLTVLDKCQFLTKANLDIRIGGKETIDSVPTLSRLKFMRFIYDIEHSFFMNIIYIYIYISWMRGRVTWLAFESTGFRSQLREASTSSHTDEFW